MRSPAKFHCLLLLVATMLGSALLLVPAPGLAFELNTDRRGGDYTNFELPRADPWLCSARCETEDQCLAWSYVTPGIQGILARCWLKNSVPAPVAADFAVSGLRPFEYNTDRPGGDFTNFELQVPNPALCAARCSGSLDAPCYGWTYVNPGVQGTLARCWLKNSERPSVPADFAVSQLRTYEYNVDRPGGDYTNFELQSPDPSLCGVACINDPQCRANTYVKPGIQGTLARCWLKNTVPPAVPADFAASAVKFFSIGGDYLGDAYLDFELSAPDAQLCAARCESESQCTGWTYVKPNPQQLLPRCRLKNSTPTEGYSPFTVSGLRMGTALPGPPQPPPTGQCPNPPNFAGPWKDPVSLGNVELTQAGNRVRGTYTGNGGGTLDGIIEGCVWQGEWINSDNVRRGTFRVELSQNGQAFKGTWETTGAGGRIEAIR